MEHLQRTKRTHVGNALPAEAMALRKSIAIALMLCLSLPASRQVTGAPAGSPSEKSPAQKSPTAAPPSSSASSSSGQHHTSAASPEPLTTYSSQTPTTREEPIPECIDPVVISNFVFNLTNVVDVAGAKTILSKFASDSVLNYHAVGQLGGNLSEAVDYQTLKTLAQGLADYSLYDAVVVGAQLAKLAKSINFTMVAETLNGVPYSSPHFGNDLAQAVDTTAFGQALVNISANVNLEYLGEYLQTSEPNVNFQALGGIVASLPKVIDFSQAGALVSQLEGTFSFISVAYVLNSFLTSFGSSLVSCNQ
ncbi:TPA: hypothetical protein ACH3X1_012320 [Trebouxia sp. C0004]